MKTEKRQKKAAEKRSRRENQFLKEKLISYYIGLKCYLEAKRKQCLFL